MDLSIQKQETAYEEGYYFAKRNDFQKAIKMFDDVLVLNENHRDARFMRSVCYSALDNYSFALKDLSYLIEHTDKTKDKFYLAELYQNRGSLLIKSKKVGAAFNDFSAALYLWPDNTKIFGLFKMTQKALAKLN